MGFFDKAKDLYKLQKQAKEIKKELKKSAKKTNNKS